MCRSVIDDCEDAHARASELVLELSKMRPCNELLRYRRFVISRDHEAWDLPDSALIVSDAGAYMRFLKFIPLKPNVYTRADAVERYGDILEEEIKRLKYRLDDTACWGCGRSNTDEGESPN